MIYPSVLFLINGKVFRSLFEISGGSVVKVIAGSKLLKKTHNVKELRNVKYCFVGVAGPRSKCEKEINCGIYIKIPSF